ncbi:MAG: cyclase family protein [Lachnospiraceae bacterium]|jgi:kynurenine formamidase|nr:cyclase family protein [Lachnospiraceae bacterium]
MKIIDLSTEIADNLPVDPLPSRAKIDYQDHMAGVESMLPFFPGATKADLPDGAGWAVEDMRLSTHTGTHLDAPYHYHPTMNLGQRAWTIDEVPLEWCMGDGVMVDFSDKPSGYVCTPDDFRRYFEGVGYRLKPFDIVLVHTNAREYWGTAEFLDNGCGVGREATLWLCRQGIHVVGTDAWSWDAPLKHIAKHYNETKDTALLWEGHKAGRECVYCHYEKLANLELLPPYGFRFIGFPVKVKGASAGWARPVALIEG